MTLVDLEYTARTSSQPRGRLTAMTTCSTFGCTADHRTRNAPTQPMRSASAGTVDPLATATLGHVQAFSDSLHGLAPSISHIAFTQ
jgi:hypothetical protein